MSDFLPDEILALLNQDTELYELLVESGFLTPGRDRFSAEDAELARVTGTLVHELEINWAGAEVILRLRTELVTERRRVAELSVRLRNQQ